MMKKPTPPGQGLKVISFKAKPALVNQLTVYWRRNPVFRNRSDAIIWLLQVAMKEHPKPQVKG